MVVSINNNNINSNYNVYTANQQLTFNFPKQAAQDASNVILIYNRAGDAKKQESSFDSQGQPLATDKPIKKVLKASGV